MTYNLLRNSTFAQPTGEGAPLRSMATFCADWFVEFSVAAPVTITPVALTPAPHGARIVMPPALRWLRIWQPIELDGVETARTGQLTLRVRKAHGEPAGLELEWAALLKVNAAGKRVLARKLTKSAQRIDGVWEELQFEAALSDLASGTPYIFAVQFSGGPGAVELESVAFACVNATAAAAKPKPAAPATPVIRVRQAPPAPASAAAPAPAARAVPPAAKPASASSPSASGAVVRVEADRVIGWATLPDAEREVLVIIDGRLIGSARATGLPEEMAKGDEKLATQGFALKVDANMLDGTERTISLRSARGRRIAKSTSRQVFAPPAAAAPPPPPPPVERPVQEITVAPVPRRRASDAPRRRVAVVSWDMAHNPVGRAFLLADMAARDADVELVGPMFPMYGNTIWPPIAKSPMAMQAYPAPTFRDFIAGARELAERVKCDVVHIGKARFSSLLIGAMIKQANRCPMIVDVDDHELGFFPNREQATLDELMAEVAADPAMLDKPYTEIFTRYAESLVAECDGVTVSNYALQQRFGGIVVRHGRDERVFNPAAYDRKAVRAAFGYGDDDRVVLFLGTPRPHKGIFEIADAMEQLADDRLALCVIGSISDRRVSSRFDAYKKARIALHPDQPWERLAELVSMADTVFLLQDPASAIADYQIPAKLTDAMALGVPVYATPVAPLRDLIASGAITAVTSAEELKAALSRLAERGLDAEQGRRARDYYLGELSYGVNAARLSTAFDAAEAHSRQVVPAFDALFTALERQSGEAMPRFAKTWTAPAIWKKAKPDVVFLWKQNDSDIYGRRSDMIVKQLLASGAINRVIHFDAAISSADLDKQAKHGSDAVAHQGNLIYLNTVKRVLRQADTPNLLRRTFLFRAGKQPERYLGADLPPRDAYEDFVRATLRDAGVSENPVLWVSPVVFDYPMFKSVVKPGVVVSDIIDDQRRFPSREEYRRRVAQAYDDILGEADLVLANCEPVQQGFADTRPDITVIPNGAEVFDLSSRWPVPEDIAHLPRPILGYVGNLRDRVDLDLIGKVADAFPQGSVVLIGSAHDRPEVIALGERPNVHLLGVKPYDQASRYIRAFDVALVPHLRNELSESMNPLKLFVYFALGVPIVTTEIANIGDIGPHSIIAGDHDAFVRGIADVLAGRGPVTSAKQRSAVLDRVSWAARVGEVLRMLQLA